MEENSAIKMIARRVTELAVKATTIVASARSGRGILGGRKGRGREGGRKGAGDGGEGQQVEEEATVVVAVDAVEFFSARHWPSFWAHTNNNRKAIEQTPPPTTTSSSSLFRPSGRGWYCQVSQPDSATTNAPRRPDQDFYPDGGAISTRTEVQKHWPPTLPDVQECRGPVFLCGCCVDVGDTLLDPTPRPHKTSSTSTSSA